MKMERTPQQFIRNFTGKAVLCALLLAGAEAVPAQAVDMDGDPLFTPPKGYIVPYANRAPVIDGKLSEGVWQQAPWSDAFVDIEGAARPLPSLRTQVKLLWNDSCLFVAAHLQEPHVWATLHRRDAIIYHDNDFEVFLDPDNDTHQYVEVEVNALNTVLDLLMPRPYRDGAGAFLGYDMAGLKTAVHVEGTLNDPSDRDSGWTVELMIPFRSVLAGNQWSAPQEGALWRINFSRVQWEVEIRGGTYGVKKTEKGARLPEHNWVWSPQGVVNMHYPERWGYLQFTRKEGSRAVFALPYEEQQKQYLWLVYYRQKNYLTQHRSYALSLKELGLPEGVVSVEGIANRLQLEGTRRQFTVSIADGSKAWSLNEEGRVQSKPKTK